MLRAFLKLFDVVSTQRYRIVHDPELGYCAQYANGVGWAGIEGDAGEGLYHGHGLEGDYACWCKTREEAQRRVTLHSTGRGQSVVWRG